MAGGHSRNRTIEHGHPEEPPTQNAEDRDEVGQPIRRPAPPARYLLSMDRDYRRKEDDQDHQQGNGSGMHTAHPELPKVSERPGDTSAKSSRRGAMDIPAPIAAKEVEAVMNPQAQFVGN